MTTASKSGSSAALVLVLGLIIGGIGGYYTRFMIEPATGPALMAPGFGGAAPRGEPGGVAAPGGPAAMAGPVAMGGPVAMAGPAAMGGQAGPAIPREVTTLTRTVRGLNALQQAQGKGLTAQQSTALLPVLTALKAAEKINAADAQAKQQQIDQVLTPVQHQMLQTLSPQRGRRGSAPAGGQADASRTMQAMPAVETMPGSPVPASPGGPTDARGASADPERPFAGERNKADLDGLIGSLRGGK